MIWALHGAFGAPGDWARLQQRGMNLRPVALWKMARELRGAGASLAGAGFEAWSEAFIERVRDEDPAPSVMGYSLGGRLALHALVAEPGLWRSAIIVSAHPGLENEADRRARLESDSHWAKRVREDSLGAVLADWESQIVFEGFRKEFDGAHLEDHREQMTAGFEEWSLGRQNPLWDRLAGVTCPVLWITGEKDEKFTRPAERAVAAMPSARHVVVAGCGHRVPWEAPGAFARTVLRFQNAVCMGRGDR